MEAGVPSRNLHRHVVHVRQSSLLQGTLRTSFSSPAIFHELNLYINLGVKIGIFMEHDTFLFGI